MNVVGMALLSAVLQAVATRVVDPVLIWVGRKLAVAWHRVKAWWIQSKTARISPPATAVAGIED